MCVNVCTEIEVNGLKNRHALEANIHTDFGLLSFKPFWPYRCLRTIRWVFVNYTPVLPLPELA